MSWARGFFRIWVVLTALYASGVAVSFAPAMRDAFAAYLLRTYIPEPCTDPKVIEAVKALQDDGVPEAAKFFEDCAPNRPIRLKIIKGPDGKNSQTPQSEAKTSDTPVAEAPPLSEASFFIRQQKALQNVATLQNADLRVQRSDALKNMEKIFWLAVLPPLVLLLIGAAFTWALRGFSAPKR